MRVLCNTSFASEMKKMEHIGKFNWATTTPKSTRVPQMQQHTQTFKLTETHTDTHTETLSYWQHPLTMKEVASSGRRHGSIDWLLSDFHPLGMPAYKGVYVCVCRYVSVSVCVSVCGCLSLSLCLCVILPFHVRWKWTKLMVMGNWNELKVVMEVNWLMVVSWLV